MKSEVDVEKYFFKILEERGGKVADEAKKLLEDIYCPSLKPSLRYVAKNWRDPFRPTLMALSCEAVGGEAESTTSAAIAVSFLNLSLNIWNDIADGVKYRCFTPTFPEKLGLGPALIIAGLATAKAYHLLNKFLQKVQSSTNYQTINKLFFDFACTMAEAEALNFSLRPMKTKSYKDKFSVFKRRSVHLKTCMELGSLEVGSKNEIRALSRYGSRFGAIMELREDLRVSLNLTMELADKIKGGSLPYTLHWMKDHSRKAQNIISILVEKQKLKPLNIQKVVNLLFETGAVDHVVKLIKKLGEEAASELLIIKENEANRLLKFLIQAQQPLTLKTLHI